MNSGQIKRRIFGKRISETRLSGHQEGFTVLELAIGVILIGIALAIIFLAYGRAHKDMAMKSGISEVEAIMQRSYNIAMQEGVDAYLTFWDAAGAHPNQCTIYRVYPDGTNEMDDDTPTEPPPPGVFADSDGAGHYWFKISDGEVGVGTTITLHFSREGALVKVSEVNGGGMSVILTMSGRSDSTVSINEAGEVSS